jgi:dehydrogenase/reductase SDR family protein 12
MDPVAMKWWERAVDELLEATVVGSFSKVGIAIRRRMSWWGESPRLDGRTVLVTGASSGIGQAAAIELAGLGASVWAIGRDPGRLAVTRRAVMAAGGGGQVRTALVDLVDDQAVRSLVDEVMSSHDRLDGVVHNAGALFARYRTAPDGTELTVATHVLAPFRLSWLLHPLLARTERSVIVTMASGGMYTQRFDLDRLESTAPDYRGVTAYARAKRAQVVLAREWARRWAGDGVASYAVHPGWVDTPGLAGGLPGFSRLGPLLRGSEEGADTAVWLVAGGDRQDRSSGTGSAMAAPGDGIWHDRRPRGEYYLPTTRRSPAERDDDGRRLWAWCAARTGVGPGRGTW